MTLYGHRDDNLCFKAHVPTCLSDEILASCAALSIVHPFFQKQNQEIAMPVPAVVASSAENFRFNSGFLKQTVIDLTPEEWLRRPDEKLNHIAWIVGHLAFSRSRVLHFMGTEWTEPGLEIFNRGSKILEDSSYPSPESLLSTWSEAGHAMAAAFQSVTEDFLAQPATQGPPSLDGKISGVVSFMAIHETYHIGQASYLRGWLGHKGLMG
jgi:hypothetical protein